MKVLNARIALRFLLSRRRGLAMSLSGVALGVAFFILAQAQTTGFERFFIQTILGTNGAIRVQDAIQPEAVLVSISSDAGQSGQLMQPTQRYSPGVQHPKQLKAALDSFEAVTASAAVLAGPVLYDTAFRSQRASIYGIEPEEFAQVSQIHQQIQDGSWDSFQENPLGLLMGSRLARALGAQAGDSIQVSNGQQFLNLRISGIFETGVADIDEDRAYAHMATARATLGRRFGVSYLQVSLRDPRQAPLQAERIASTLGHFTAPWQERERVWLGVFRALRISAAISLSSILVIAGVGMFSSLALMVMEKSRQIAILRSSGFSREDIAAIFIWQATLLLVGGALIGCLLALAATWGLSQLPLRIRGIFSTDTFVVAWSGWHYLYAVLAATLAVLPAALLPARKAARIEPANVFRSTSQ